MGCNCVKLIVGLGNPGIEYQFTPHNLGFLTVDRIADDLKVQVKNRQCRALTAKVVIGQEEAVLAKPETFMNLSGQAVRELVEKLEIKPEADLIVIYDELDLPMGTIRIRQRGSSAGHTGMKSIIGASGGWLTSSAGSMTVFSSCSHLRAAADWCMNWSVVCASPSR